MTNPANEPPDDARGDQHTGYPPLPGYSSSGRPLQYAPDHPNATTALVLGIVGIAVCGGVLSPFAWVMGHKAVREIDASGGTIGGRGSAQAGYILGIVGSIMLAVGILMVVAYLLIMVVMFAGVGGMTGFTNTNL